MSKGTKTDIGTIVKLFAPKEVGVTLIPLQDFENIEFLRFWSSIFFGVFTAFLGSVVSLLVTPYDNAPVLYVLGISTILFLLMFSAFSVKSFAASKAAKNRALFSDDDGEEDGLEQAARAVKLLGDGKMLNGKRIALFHIVRMECFNEQDSVTLVQFNKHWADQDHAELSKIAFGLRVVEKFEKEGEPYVRLNPELLRKHNDSDPMFSLISAMEGEESN